MPEIVIKTPEKKSPAEYEVDDLPVVSTYVLDEEVKKPNEVVISDVDDKDGGNPSITGQDQESEDKQGCAPLDSVSG